MLKIKRKLSLALAVILIISIFAGCAAQKAETDSTKDDTTITQTVSAETEQTSQKGNESETTDKQVEDTTDKTTESNSASSASKEKEKEKEKTTSKSSGAAKTTQKKTTQATAKTTKKPESTVSTCTLTIECTAVLDNMSSLKAGHEKYVPDDGYILSNKKMTVSKGNTVYDVLKEACSENGIRLTASNSTFGIYVSGINNIDEKDCGKNSGWTYWVNGNMPMVTCGKYTVNNGDEIKFSYVV